MAQVRDIIGGFCAAFLAFVAMGGTLALIFAEPYNVNGDCWPHQTLFGFVRAECHEPLADAAWRATAVAARYFAVVPALALAQLVQVVRTGSTYWLDDAVKWGEYAVPILIVCMIGFFHVRARSPVLAWVLLALLVGEIGVGVAPHITGDLVEPM
jgi:hypothetical protein